MVRRVFKGRKTAQMRGQTRNAGVELRVSEPAFAGKIDRRQFVRRAAGKMRDPVIVANRQNLLQRSSGLGPSDLLDLTPFRASWGAVSGCCLAFGGWRDVQCRAACRVD